ncbi:MULTISPECIES: hypothetical protein [unclassified Beijerinckia]|uniref:hypothetical protein n=1 Tax=unclassified Beijerinckia TaxID=2638183 RepID=UPI000895E5DD|nr:MULTISPECIES: hypothetical protein [unclassified Beijerinckia]MDH7799905.1 hypothetical protein [Beijerinckia sp. GAS462]SED41861.1 hypothetical protein SAMN05443249_5323 [Beijerinckia sp. 28-YEA-48]
MHILRIVLLVIALVASAFLSWRFFDGALHYQDEASRIEMKPEADRLSDAQVAEERTAITGLLAQTPEFASYFEAMRAAYPSDHTRILNTFAERAVRGHRTGTPDFYLTEATRALRHSRGILAAKASDAALQNVFDRQFDVISAMEAADPQTCTDFLHGGAASGFFDFAQANRPLMAKLAQASLDAMIDGQKSTDKREAPGDSDFRTLEEALRARGLGTPEIESLLDARTPDPPLPDAAMCHAGRVYLETLRDLPEDLRLRIYALAIELQARS